MKLAVCIVHHDRDGKLVIVARKKRHDDWNLPGGKVEDDETLEEAAYRELQEETGLFASKGAMSVLRVFQDVIDDITCVCFITVPHHIYGEVKQQKGEAPARWGQWEDILGVKSSFRDYNKKLYKELKKQGYVR